jgi:hypothetical protein
MMPVYCVKFGCAGPRLYRVAKKKDSTLVRLGENLRKVREQRGWSQEELAFRAGRSQRPALRALGYRSSDRAVLPEGGL